MAHLSLLAAAVDSLGSGTTSTTDTSQHHLSDGQLTGVVLVALVVPILIVTAGFCLRPKRWRSKPDNGHRAEEATPEPVVDIFPHQRKNAGQTRLDNLWETATRARVQDQSARSMPPTRHGGEVLLQRVRGGENLLETSIVEENELEDETPVYLQLPDMGPCDGFGEQHGVEENDSTRKRSDTEMVWWAPDGSRLPYHEKNGRWYAKGNDGQTRRIRACTEACLPSAVYEDAAKDEESLSAAEEREDEMNEMNEESGVELHGEHFTEQHKHQDEGSPGHEEEPDAEEVRSEPESEGSD